MYDAIKKIGMIGSLVLVSTFSYTQNVSSELAKAFRIFETDSQLKNAISSLYVIDASSGKTVFSKNSQVGLAPASTQKMITAATAYEILGRDFRYQTEFGIASTGETKNAGANQEQLSVVVKPSGDPTLGSWRWAQTKEDVVIKRVVDAARSKGISGFNEIRFVQTGWNAEPIPDGWIRQDIGNYFGAAPHSLNWRENQYDVVLKSGGVGSAVEIVKTIPELPGLKLVSYATAAEKGSGDRTNIYFTLTNIPGEKVQAVIRGTIPSNEKNFVVSGSIPDPVFHFQSLLAHSFKVAGINEMNLNSNGTVFTADDFEVFHTEYSPALDSINYWFLRKSVNLYGESLLRTMAYKKTGDASPDKGIDLAKDLWKTRGVAATEINMYDGSGLSPQNRVTTHALVHVLKYSRSQPWFDGYYDAIPVYNGMKMKSGTINGVKSFCGYHKAGNGKEYIFAFIVNNYNGSSSGLVNKMYRVLNELK